MADLNVGLDIQLLPLVRNGGHRPQRPPHVLTAAIFRTDTGHELRIGFSETNLIHSRLSRKGDAPLLARAEDLRVVLLGQGWVELMTPAAVNAT